MIKSNANDNRRRWRLIAFAPMQILTLLASTWAAPSVAQAATRPNFVFFLADDQAYADMGCAGNPAIKTPAMDELARDGIFFENAFVTTAICCSSRASVLVKVWSVTPMP